MKIKIQLAAIVLLMAGFMSSCIMKDDFADCPPKKPLRVVSTIDFGDGTTLWPKGSDIGITVFKAGTNECFGNNSDKHYLISDTQTGESVPEESGDPIYLPEGEEEADIIAYYPYTTPFDKNYKAHLSVLDQSQPDSLDLITSDRVCNVPSDTELVELKFYRRLTKLVFNITMIEVGPDGKETVVNHQLPGTKLDITGMPVLYLAIIRCRTTFSHWMIARKISLPLSIRRELFQAPSSSPANRAKALLLLSLFLAVRNIPS